MFSIGNDIAKVKGPTKMGANDGYDREDLARALDDVVGEARSEGGLVSVKVDSKGRVARVWLDQQVSGVSVDRLAEAIAAVCAEAFNNRLDRLADLIADYDRTHGLGLSLLDHLHTSIDRLR